MAFTIPYSYRGMPEIPAAYIRLDNYVFNKESGCVGTFRIYATQAIRLADLGNDLVGASFVKTVPYVANTDMCTALYDAAKVDFPNAVDA